MGDLMEMASMFEDNSEDHESVARRSDDPSADFEPTDFEDDNEFDFSLEDLMALAAELEGENSENEVARRSDDASEQAPASDEDFNLEDLMELAALLEQEGAFEDDLEGDDEFENDEDLEDFDENDLEDFDENDLQAAFAD